MRTGTLRELLVEQLKDMYNMENQLVKALPKMADASTSGDLSSAFEEHLEQTRGHVLRLERAFEELGVATKGKKCLGMEGLIDEGKEVLQEDLPPETLDAGIIGAAQKVEHYEIAAYGTARTHAQLLGLDSVAQLLEQTLEEEKETDQKLTELAQEINPQAQMGSDDEETTGRRRSTAGNGELEEDETPSRRARTRASSRS